MYSINELESRRHLKRVHRKATAFIAGIMLALMVAMLFASGPVPEQANAADTVKVTCNERCQLERRLTAMCPSQPLAMTRRRCVQWVQVAQCETGGQQYRVTLRSIQQVRWRYSGPGYYDGGLQFSPTTWTSNMNRIPARQLTRKQRIDRREGRYRFAYGAPPAVQILAAEVLRQRIGGNPAQTAGWPICGAWFW